MADVDYLPQATAACQHIAEGMSATKAVKEAGIGLSTFFRLLADPEQTELRENYARGREARADARFEKLDDIMDDLKTGAIDAQQARVMMDAIKWQTGKEKAKVYGDKVAVTDPDGGPLKIIRETITREGA